MDVEHSHVRFLGNLVLSLWDCGGQDTFYENYFDSQRDHIFPNVEVLIYVFDIDSSELDVSLQLVSFECRLAFFDWMILAAPLVTERFPIL